MNVCNRPGVGNVVVVNETKTKKLMWMTDVIAIQFVNYLIIDTRGTERKN